MTTIASCEICGYVFAERHHVIPQAIGGPDQEWNYIWLCPNHHTAVHFLLSHFRKAPKDQDDRRLGACFQDTALIHFFESVFMQIWAIGYLKTKDQYIATTNGTFVMTQWGVVAYCLERWRKKKCALPLPQARLKPLSSFDPK